MVMTLWFQTTVVVHSHKGARSLGVQFTDSSVAPDALQKGAIGQCAVAKTLYRDIMRNLKKHNFWFIQEDEDQGSDEDEDKDNKGDTADSNQGNTKDKSVIEANK